MFILAKFEEQVKRSWKGKDLLEFTNSSNIPQKYENILEFHVEDPKL